MNNQFFKKEKIILIEELFLKQSQNEVEQNRQFDEISSLKSFKRFDRTVEPINSWIMFSLQLRHGKLSTNH